MPDFDVFPLLECKTRKSRSHCKRITTSQNHISIALNDHGPHCLLSFFSSVPCLSQFYVI